MRTYQVPNEREGSEDTEGEREGNEAEEESGAEVGEGGKGKKRTRQRKGGGEKGKGGVKRRIERATEGRKGTEEDEQSARMRGVAVIVHVWTYPKKTRSRKLPGSI